MPIVHFDEPLLSLYIRLDDPANVTLDFIPGMGDDADRYSISDLALSDESLAVGTWNGVVRVGTAATQDVSDERRGALRGFRWDGSAEVNLEDQLADLTDQIAALSDQISDLALQITATQDQITSLAEDVAAVGASVDALGALITSLSDAVTALGDQFVGFQDTLDAIAASIGELNTARTVLRQVQNIVHETS